MIISSKLANLYDLLAYKRRIDLVLMLDAKNTSHQLIILQLVRIGFVYLWIKKKSYAQSVTFVDSCIPIVGNYSDSQQEE